MSDEEVRVNFRWSQTQVDVIKQAAALAGVPYQSWLKMTAYRQAIKDLRDAQVIEDPDVKPPANANQRGKP